MPAVNASTSNLPLPMALGAWNLDTLLAEIADRDQKIEAQSRTIESLQERIDSQALIQRRMQESIESMQAKLAGARQALFAASSEQMRALQPEIFREVHESPMPPPAEDLTVPVEGHRRKRRSPGRPALPDDLPVERIVHEMPAEERAGYDKVTVIGQTVTKVLKYVPGEVIVVEHVCPRYALVKDGVSTVRSMTHQASPLMKSNAGPELLARIVVARFEHGMPYHRLEEEFGIYGVRISRNTMGDWVIAMSKLASALYMALHRQLLRAPVIFGDDTPHPQTGKKRGRTETVRLWAYASAGQVLTDDRWVDVPKVVYYDYTATRAGCHPLALLKDYRGYLQADDYSGWAGLFRAGQVHHVACHAHARRAFVKIYRQLRKDTPETANDSIAADALRWIRQLYVIERKVREADPPERRRVRQAESVPILRDYKTWLLARAGEVLPRSPIGRAIAYTLSNWEALTRYVDDGNLAIDSNYVERAIRRVAVTRKNILFFGSADGGRAAAVMFSLLATCRVNDINPYEYLVDVLQRINEHPVNRIEELLPYNWRPRAAEVATSRTLH